MAKYVWITAGAIALAGNIAVAGDNNRVDLLQITTGSFGNTLTVDQSGADNSLVTGDRFGLTPARQIGDQNEAVLTLTGDGGTATLGQGVIGAPATANSAEATVAGLGGLGAIQQLGNGNAATLEVTSIDALLPAEGIIGQFGNNNTASLTVEGINVSGTLLQVGSNNVNSLEVGGEDSSVVFTQIGNNLANPDAAGTQVFTNAGNVTITQVTFGTFRR